jgi:hypothetical protein
MGNILNLEALLFSFNGRKEYLGIFRLWPSSAWKIPKLPLSFSQRIQADCQTKSFAEEHYIGWFQSSLRWKGGYLIFEARIARGESAFR